MKKVEKEKKFESVDLKLAIEAAVKSLKSAYSEEQLEDISIEEFERTSSFWKITLAFKKASSVNSSQYYFDPLKGREFKTFEISLKDGSVKSMKLRLI